MKNMVNRALAAKKRKLSSLIATLTLQDNMVSQVYNDICVKLYTQDHHMREGETRTVELTMVEDHEYMEGREVVHESWKRNPTVWEGAYINIHRDKNGHYQVHLKRMEMNKRFNAVRIAKAIETELLTAKRVLGLCKK